MIRVFVGYDFIEAEAFHVFSQSLLERSSVPVSITAIQRRQLPLTRPRHHLQSNDFAFSRWFVPWLCDYHGWALFADCDFLCRWDIADLLQYRDDTKDVLVCQHQWQGEDTKKFLGNTQTAYERKCWSSLMLFNNERCRQLSPAYIDQAPGLDLHQFKWTQNIGSLPVEWNHLVDVYPYDPGAKMVHFTKGGPWLRDYRECDYADEWHTQRWKTVYSKDVVKYA